jgi:hypothetical protein
LDAPANKPSPTPIKSRNQYRRKNGQINLNPAVGIPKSHEIASSSVQKSCNQMKIKAFKATLVAHLLGEQIQLRRSWVEAVVSLFQPSCKKWPPI